MAYDTFIQDFIHEFAGELWDKDIKDTMHKQMNLGGQSVRDLARHNALNNFYLTLSDNPEYQPLRETDLRALLLRCLPAASQNAIRMAPNPALVAKVDDIVNYIEKGNLPGARAHSTTDSGQTRTPSRARFDSRSGPQTGPSAPVFPAQGSAYTRGPAGSPGTHRRFHGRTRGAYRARSTGPRGRRADVLLPQ